jgi:nucleoside-diphosphate-sugar epimerase
MKILVTGGAGYIGDSAVDYLLNLGHEVVILDSLMYGGHYMRQHANLSFVRGDIRDRALITKLVLSCDSVLHLAAIVGDGACAANPSETVSVNERATEHIASLCIANDKMMTFASTCSVYGKNNHLLKEDSPTNPLSLYAGTKLNAERIVQRVPRHNIFRLGTLFGLSGPYARLRCDLVANILTYKACQNKPLTVFGGEQWRPLLHVRDAGELMALAASKSEEPDCGYGIHILSWRNFTMAQLAKDILDILDKPSELLTLTDMKFEDQRNYRVSSSRSGRYWLTRFTLLNAVVEMQDIMNDGRIANIWDAAFHNAKYVKESNNA